MYGFCVCLQITRIYLINFVLVWIYEIHSLLCVPFYNTWIIYHRDLIKFFYFTFSDNNLLKIDKRKLLMVISWSNSSKIYFFHLAPQLIRLTLLSDQNVKNLKIISLSSCHVLFYSHKNSIWSSSSMRTSSRIRFMQQYQRLLSKNISHRIGIRYGIAYTVTL